MSNKLIFDHVDKVFGDGDSSVKVLDKVSLEVKAGEFVAVVGPSGSGKSTFLSIAGALLSPTTGRILIDENDISQLTEKKLNRIRLEKIGFLFRSSHLIPYLTVHDQLLLISKLAGNDHKEAKQRAVDLLEKLGLKHRIHNYPQSLSGGER